MSYMTAAARASKRSVGQILAQGWQLTLPATAAASRRLHAGPLEGLAFHLSEGLSPRARYQVARLGFDRACSST